jgi:membrane protein DedA with SNARE-associated domain
VDTALSIINAITGLPAALLYLVVVIWLVVESMGVPIPNEAILLFSGFLVSAGHLNLFAAWAVSIVGTLGGATVAWWIARRYGPAGVRKIGHFVFLTPGRLHAAEGFFHRRGAATVFVARLTPIVRTVVSYPAGLAAMRYRPFLVATAAGCAIWTLLVLLVGQAAGAHWRDLFERFHTPVLLVGVLVILAAAAFVVFDHMLKKRFAAEVESEA